MATVETGSIPKDPVTLTQQLVRTPSVNPALEDGGTGEEAIARLTASWLTAWGYAPTVDEVAPGRFNVVGRRGAGRGRSLLLNGHLDTVGIRGMSDPFSGSIDDGRLRGRGACDMKSGVACALDVARSLRDVELAGELVIALTADEEHASLGMQAVVDAGIRADAAVVCEPTSLAIMPAHKGFLWIDTHVQGRAAHGSRPEVGIDAIVNMGHVLMALDHESVRLANETSHPLLGPASIHAGTIEGGAAPSIYPEDCRLVVERRTLPGETEDAVMADMDRVVAEARTACPQLDVRVEAGLFRPGTEVPTDSPLVGGLRAACEASGLPPRVEGMTAWVDASFLNETGTPALCFGPGSIAQAHTVDEWVDVSEITTCARVLTRFARTFLTGSPI